MEHKRNAGYEGQRSGTVAGARDTVGSSMVQKSRIQCYNCKEYGHVARECQKPKRVKDTAYHREKMLLCKQEEVRIQLNAKQADWRDDTDDEFDDQELEAHYMYMAKLQQVSPYVVDSGPIFDKEPEQKIEQNDEDVDLAKERELLASLISKLKCEIDETKNRNTLLETSNKVLVEKFKNEIADFKNKNKILTEANNKLSEVNAHLYADYKKSKEELKRRNTIEYATEMELECAKVKGELLSNKMEHKRYFEQYTHIINGLNQTVSELQNKLSAHQDTISVLKQQKDAQIKLYKTREDKDIEKVIDLENKVKVLDNIVYKTGQSVQTMNMLNNKCRTSFVKPKYLKKAKQSNPRLYDIGCYNDNLALMLSLESDEVIRLEKESRSKLSDLVRPFDYAKLNSLYDLFVPQREKSSEQRFFLELSRMSHINAQKEKKKEFFQKQTIFLETRLNESILGNKKCQSSFEIENIQRNINTIVTGVVLCKQKITNPTWYGLVEPVVQNMIEKFFDPVISRINVGLHMFLKQPEQKVQNDDHYDVFTIDCQHSEKSEFVHNTYLIEQDSQNVIIESQDMNYDRTSRLRTVSQKTLLPHLDPPYLSPGSRWPSKAAPHERRVDEDPSLLWKDWEH
nr:hypothetical protein [Tanacetum cinerariifolium]